MAPDCFIAVFPAIGRRYPEDELGGALSLRHSADMARRAPTSSERPLPIVVFHQPILVGAEPLQEAHVVNRAGTLSRRASAGAAGLFVLLSGCVAQDNTPDPPEGWTEPGWMAQARQEVEEYQSAMMSCLAEYGVKGIATIGGTVGVGGVTDESGKLAEGMEELMSMANRECDERIDSPTVWDAPKDDAGYQRMQDVRQCLIAHGYELPDPPSFETWREQETVWTPYDAIIDGTAGQKLSDDQLRELMNACPQSGSGALTSVIPDDAW